MDRQPNTTEQLLNTLSFKIEAVPQETVVLSKSTTSTPINVKIKVNQVEKDGSGQKKILSLPKLSRRHKVPDTIRLVNSDQTIMSFNVVMRNEADQKSMKTLRKQIFHIFKSGGCLKTQDEINEYSYKPTTSKKENNINQVQPTISNQNFKSNTSEFTGKEVSILGRCKPGGCLDPPFDEDKYVFQPTTKYVTSDPIEIQKNVPKIKSSSLCTQKIRKNESVNISASKTYINEITKRESQIGSVISGQNVESVQNKLKSSFSNAIITYPLDSSSTEFYKEMSDKNIKKIFLTEANQGYFLPPKKIFLAVKEISVSNKSDSNTFVSKVTQEFENNSTHGDFHSSNISKDQLNKILQNTESNFKPKILGQSVDSQVKILNATNTQATDDNETNFTQTPVSNSLIEYKSLIQSDTNFEPNLDKSLGQEITETNSFHKIKLRNIKNDLFSSENTFNRSSIAPNDKTHWASNSPLLSKADTENNIKQFQKVLQSNDQNNVSNHTNTTSNFSNDKICGKQIAHFEKENSLINNFDAMSNKIHTPVDDTVFSNITELDYNSFKNITLDSGIQVNEHMKEEYEPKPTILLDVPSITISANLLTADRIQKKCERQTFLDNSNLNVMITPSHLNSTNKATKSTSENVPHKVLNNNMVIDSESQKNQKEQMLIENVAEDMKIHKTVLNKDNEVDVADDIRIKKLFCEKNCEYESNGDEKLHKKKLCEISSTNNVNTELSQLSTTDIIGDDNKKSKKNISKESIISVERSLFDKSDKSSKLLHNFEGKNLIGSTEYLTDDVKYDGSKKIESPLVSDLQSDLDFLVDDFKKTYERNSYPHSVRSEKNTPVQAYENFSETLNLDSNYLSSEKLLSDPGNHNDNGENKNEVESIIRNINLLEIVPLSVAEEISTNKSFDQNKATLKQLINNTNKAATETVTHYDFSMIPEVTANSDSNHIINSERLSLDSSIFKKQEHRSKESKLVSRKESVIEANGKIILRKNKSIHSDISTERNENESDVVTNLEIIKTDNMLFTSSPVITVESLTKRYEKVISPIQSEFTTAKVISAGIINKHSNVNTPDSECENLKTSKELSFNKLPTSKTSTTKNEEKINQLTISSKNINSESDIVTKSNLTIPSDISAKSYLLSIEETQFRKDSYSKKVISKQINAIITETDTTGVNSVNVEDLNQSLHVLKYDNTNTTNNEIKITKEIDYIRLDNLVAPNNAILLNEERVFNGLETDISNNLNNEKFCTLLSSEKKIKDPINKFENSSMKLSKDLINVNESICVGSNKHSRLSSLNSEIKNIENKENANQLITNFEDIDTESDILAKSKDVVATSMFNEAPIHNIYKDKELAISKETYIKQDDTKKMGITLSEGLNKSFDDNIRTIDNEDNVTQGTNATKEDSLIVSNDTIVIKDENVFNISTKNRKFEPDAPNEPIFEKLSTPLSIEKSDKEPISELKNSPIAISKDASVSNTCKTQIMALDIANSELSSIDAKSNLQNIVSQEVNENISVKEDFSYFKKDASRCLSKNEVSVKDERYSTTTMDIKYKELLGVQKGNKNILKSDADVQTSNVFNNAAKSVLSRGLFTKIDIVPSSHDSDVEYLETINLVNPISFNKVYLGTMSHSERSDHSSRVQVQNSQSIPINEIGQVINENVKHVSQCNNKLEKSSESTFVHSFVCSVKANESNDIKSDDSLKATSKAIENEELISVPGHKNGKDIEKAKLNPPTPKNCETPFNLAKRVVSLDKKQKITYPRYGSVSKHYKNPCRIPLGILDTLRFSVGTPEKQGQNDGVMYSKPKQNDNNDEIKFANLLNNIHEKELIPLRNIMKDLKDNVDELAKRSEMYREFSAKDRKSKRLIQTNKKCGCIKE